MLMQSMMNNNDVVGACFLPLDIDSTSDDVQKIQSGTGTVSESRYPKRKRIIKSMTEDWESDLDDEDDLNEDDDDEVSLASATTAVADNAGIRMASSSGSPTPADYNDGMLLDFQILPPSETKSKHCRAVSCAKFSQGQITNGFCHSHNSRYLMCTGLIPYWTCDECGNRNISKRVTCNTCHVGIRTVGGKKRKGRTAAAAAAGTTANKRKRKNYSSGSGNEEEEDDDDDDEDDEKVTFLRSTPAARRKDSHRPTSIISSSRRRSSNNTRGVENDRYPRRNSRKSTADERLLPLSSFNQPHDLPSTFQTTTPSWPPRRFRPTTTSAATTATPNSIGSSSNSYRSGVDIALDNMLDFEVVASSSSFTSSSPTTTKSKRQRCRAKSCDKYSQTRSNGFCRKHYNRYLLCTGQYASRTCMDCGHENVEYLKQCSECCVAWKGEADVSSPMTVLTGGGSSKHISPVVQRDVAKRRAILPRRRGRRLTYR